jgi:molybdopterin converting factor small subunit
MTVQVVLPGVLADLIGGARHVDVPVPDGPRATVGDVLDRLAGEHPLLGRRIRDETGAVRRFVNVYLDGEDVRFADGVRTPVQDGAVLQVLPSVAGGC